VANRSSIQARAARSWESFPKVSHSSRVISQWSAILSEPSNWLVISKWAK